MQRSFRILKIRSTDLNGRGAGQKILHRVFGRKNPTEPDDGNLHGFRALIDHPQGNGPDRRAGKPSGDIADARLERFGIDRHRQISIGNGQRIRPAVFGRTRHLRDVGNIGRQFHDQRSFRSVLQPCREVSRQFRICSENHAAAFRIRARDIQFVCSDSVASVQFFDDFDVFIFGKAKHVHDDRAAGITKKWHLVADECIDTDILETDGVEHSGRRGEEAGRAVAGNWLRRSPLHNDRANALQIDESGEFFAITKCPTGRDNGVPEADSRELNGKVGRLAHIRKVEFSI